jgi:hypothetical protein
VSTIRSQIVAASVAALDSDDEDSGKPEGLTVIPRRAGQVKESEMPLTMVGRVSEKVTRPAGKLRYPVTERYLEIELDHWVKADTEEPLEPLIAWGTKALQNDSTLSGLVLEVEEDSIDWDVEATDTGFARARQRFTVRFPTKTNDQEKKQ